MVVFPQPLAPTMIVRGKQNAMTCSSSSGEKERTPLMDNFEIDAIMMNLYIFWSTVLPCRQIKNEEWMCHRFGEKNMTVSLLGVVVNFGSGLNEI
jgi:hypothetical protein